MLVALQRTGADRPLSPAVVHLVELLRAWGPGPEHLTGLALVGVSLPGRVVDALVFTRSGVVVIAAHAPGPGEWPGPGHRTGAAVEAARGALAGHEGGRYVTGLVAVVPPAETLESGREVAAEPPGSRLEPTEDLSTRLEAVADRHSGRLDIPPEPEAGPHGSQPGPAVGPPGTAAPEPAADPRGSQPISAVGPPGTAAPEPAADPRGSRFKPPEPQPPTEPTGQPAFHWREPAPIPGVAVVRADPRGLRRIIRQHNRWRTVWSADDILDACYALSLAHLAPPRSALLADGFPARLPARSQLPELPAVVALPPEPPAPVAEDDPWTPPVRGPGSAVFPRPRPVRQVPWGLVFVLTLLVTAGVVAAVFVAQVFHGS
ncbi:hypothetical protein [Amycolatopsis sp. CA-128772]|uniref:hypothetical protein n=1 Tax=Amycolatopsis sp. CA-128772 TaxID=2073159 RepID=UPI000CD1B721|nr:hypothetical protein [Amycolatopsis sp. CA-128772]